VWDARTRLSLLVLADRDTEACCVPLRRVVKVWNGWMNGAGTVLENKIGNIGRKWLEGRTNVVFKSSVVYLEPN
jgi:hypothetical protein